jgi:hypothetical protein
MGKLLSVLRIRHENREKETTMKVLQTLHSKLAKTTQFSDSLEFTKRNRATTMSYYTSSLDHATSLHETWINKILELHSLHSHEFIV